ncbi:phosphate binding protein [Aeromicrobium marinum DSM 15272]|uniref:Phosphate-binding protein n=1 Tax=Aeromicrobium marinum DSM 15272 TaxID=585531 RepID=E2SBS4_9ACTN|nr:PstS family phosphate ABC transporter substrate-binding protein [Aeromicrobium marinum]EFQ83210.1 phosphate binding protein [Aeromicrobium marinum DSM 15272]
MNRRTKLLVALPAAAVLTLGLAACGGDADGGSSDSGSISGEVVSDGSSTVQPLTAAAGELFGSENSGVNVSVGTSGTGGGFEKFCLGETDISNASRPIGDDEIVICEENGIEFTELRVASDALSIVVSQDNEFLECLTTDELATLWGPAAEGTITSWDQVNPEFPAETIELYGPGTDSGTFDYFTDEINGEEGASRSDYNASEDDNVIVQGVSGSEFALGYFGLSYFLENSGSLKTVQVDSGDGCVEPSAETVADDTYTPLGRPLFIYVKNESYADKPQVAAFVDYFVEQSASIAEAAEFIALNDEQQGELEDVLAGLAG